MIRNSGTDKWRRLIVAVAVISTASTTLAGSPAAASSTRTTIPGNGTYRVNTDFKAGLYRSIGNDGCYWERAKNASGDFSAIIANDNVDGQGLVLIRSGDKVFKTSGCHTWRRVSAKTQKTKSKKTTIPGNGVYLVGADFKPGTYRSKANSGCYWERASSADGTFDSIIANDNVDGQAIVTINRTDKVFSTSGCHAWKRIE
jgi:hypothetical protein